MTLMGLDHIGVPTEDTELSSKFYEELGFSLVGDFKLGPRPFKFYRLGNLTVELVPTDKAPGVEGAVAHFAIECKGIEEVYAFCQEKGYKILNDRILELGAFWENGQKCFNIEGPNKEKIEFVELL